jgi:hypothetical protein
MERLVGCQKANECSWEPCPSCGVPYGHLHKENCSCLQPPAPSSTGATLSPFELPIGEFLVSHPSPDAGLVERLRAQIDYSPEDRGSAIFEEAAAALEVKDAEILNWAKAGTRWTIKLSEAKSTIEAQAREIAKLKHLLSRHFSYPANIETVILIAGIFVCYALGFIVADIGMKP